jgi:hypothetical protein
MRSWMIEGSLRRDFELSVYMYASGYERGMWEGVYTGGIYDMMIPGASMALARQLMILRISIKAPCLLFVSV